MNREENINPVYALENEIDTSVAEWKEKIEVITRKAMQLDEIIATLHVNFVDRKTFNVQLDKLNSRPVHVLIEVFDAIQRINNIKNT